MAKALKSFAEKLKGSGSDKKQVRVIKSVRDPETGAVRFEDRMVGVPTDADVAQYIAEQGKKK